MALVGSLVLLYKNWDEISNIILNQLIVYQIHSIVYIMISMNIFHLGERGGNIYTGIKNTIIESITNAINFGMEYINPFINKISSIVSKVGSIKKSIFPILRKALISKLVS